MTDRVYSIIPFTEVWVYHKLFSFLFFKLGEPGKASQGDINLASWSHLNTPQHSTIIQTIYVLTLDASQEG